MKMTVFWDVALCSLVEVKRRFSGLDASKIRAISKWRARNWFQIWQPVRQGRNLQAPLKRR
jgi:hypothetical protein